MTIKFHSDSSYVDQGFTAEYEAFIPSNRKSDFYFFKFSDLFTNFVFLSTSVCFFGFGFTQLVRESSDVPTTCA